MEEKRFVHGARVYWRARCTDPDLNLFLKAHRKTYPGVLRVVREVDLFPGQPRISVVLVTHDGEEIGLFARQMLGYEEEHEPDLSLN